MTVLYDGTAEGFLSLVYEVYYQKLHVNAILKKMPQTLIFERVHEIFTDALKSQKVLQALQKHFTKEHQKIIFSAFLCDTYAYEMALLDYIKIGFKNPKELNNINDPSIFYLQNLEKELLRFVHKMYGFTRFEALEDESLYARIETKFNVLPLLGEHFIKRLGTFDFIIHDVTRSLAFIKNGSHHEIRSIASFDAPSYSSEEEAFKALWKTFFKATAIENRHNPKLQQNFVPLLYRTYMSEFQT